jgi:ATP-dependent RNA helicase DeaD
VDARERSEPGREAPEHPERAQRAKDREVASEASDFELGRAREGAALSSEKELAPDARPRSRAGHDPGHETDPGEEGMTRLFVNVGRRDGMRAGDIARLFRDAVDLKRADIGRIRVRDKHSFVDVVDERVDSVLESLPGRTVHDRELVVERAKAGG